MSKLSDFVAQFLPDAQRASAATGINADVILAQAALESGYGQSAPGNNLFGIKGSGGTQTTKEYINGKWVTIQAAFKGYSSKSQSFDGYADFMSGKRYSGVATNSTSDAQIAAIKAAKYATDPDYVAKVSSIASSIRTQFAGADLTPFGAATTPGGPKMSGNAFIDAIAKAQANVQGTVKQGVDTATKALDVNSWFQRGAFMLFALLLIAAALFAFKSGNAISLVSKAGKVLQ